MNQETRYALAFYQMGDIIRESLEYAIPNASLNAGLYKSRKEMINHLLDEKSPIIYFCNNNGEVGKKILSQVKDFYDDVYGDESRIVKIDHDQVVVESSLHVQLLDYIVGLHETFTDICYGFKTQFEKDGKLEEGFTKLLDYSDRLYRALAIRTILLNTNAKFMEFNAAVKSYVESTAKSTGVDPRTQPDFDPSVDPSVKFINNEMGKLIGFFRFVKAHNHSEFDPQFVATFNECENKIHLYDGSRKLLPGQTMPSALKDLEDTIVPYLKEYRTDWAATFEPIMEDLRKFEQAIIDSNKPSDGGNA